MTELGVLLVNMPIPPTIKKLFGGINDLAVQLAVIN